MALQPPQAGSVMAQPPLPPAGPPAMRHDSDAAPTSWTMAQPPLPTGPPLIKRQRSDHFDMPCGQHITSYEQGMTGLDEAIGLCYGPYLHSEMPSFGASEPSLPPDASNTLYVEVGREFEDSQPNIRFHGLRVPCMRYRAVRSAYYRGSLGAMVVYDATRHRTFEHVAQWVEELRAHANGSTVVALIGNKADMPAHRREVPAYEASRFAEEQGPFFSEASALTGDNVERAFLTLLEEIFAVVSRRALEFDEARRMRNGGGNGGAGGDGDGEVLPLKGTKVDASAAKKSSLCGCS